MKFLVIRFRQIGDSILATCVFNTIKRNFPDSETYFVLNENIAPIFQGHPSIDNIVTFSNEERHSPLCYITKIWKLMRSVHFDVIIDMRSTPNTTPFALFSPFTKYRIGLEKKYTRFVYNYRISCCSKEESVVEHNLRFLAPLNKIKPIEPDNHFTLSVTDEEVGLFHSYMEKSGIDFNRSVILFGISAKLEFKRWRMDRMEWLLKKFMKYYPDTQIIFNYVPGRESDDAHKIYDEMSEEDRKRIFINIEAKGLRQLNAMSTCVDAFIGNEGGVRHVVHAMGKPSFVICAPGSNKTNWIPKNDVPAEAVAITDVMSPNLIATSSYEEQYAAITKDFVWDRLKTFCNSIFCKSD